MYVCIYIYKYMYICMYVSIYIFMIFFDMKSSLSRYKSCDVKVMSDVIK